MSVATHLRRLMKDAIISLASPVNRQGRQVADVIAGMERKNKGSIGTAIVRAFGIPLLRQVLASALLVTINPIQGNSCQRERPRWLLSRCY